MNDIDTFSSNFLYIYRDITSKNNLDFNTALVLLIVKSETKKLFITAWSSEQHHFLLIYFRHNNFIFCRKNGVGIFFIYDHTMLQKEEDDLKDAILYFYPPFVSSKFF